MKRPRRLRAFSLILSLGMLVGFVASCAFLNACILGQAWLYVSLLVLAVLSGAGLHKLIGCR